MQQAVVVKQCIRKSIYKMQWN